MSEQLSPVLAPRKGSTLVFEVSQLPRRRKISLAARTAGLFPYVVAGFVWAVAGLAGSVVAWFAILATGHYPPALFAFNARVWRFQVRANAYASLLVDARPSYSGEPDPSYPLQVDVTPLPEYNRLLTAFRFPLLIPLWIVTFLAMLAGYIAFIPSLLLVTFVRHQPAALQSIMAMAVRAHARFLSSMLLLTEILWVTD
jgi:Domain of unknown function (DUF4389)